MIRKLKGAILGTARSWLGNYRDLPMARKISVAVLTMLIPMVILMLVWFFNVLQYNDYYNESVKNMAVISQFSLDFKENYDYKIYLIVVGNKEYEEQKPVSDIESARRILIDIKSAAISGDSQQIIRETERNLDNLQHYTVRIRDNIEEGGHYDENIEIWETGVQTITRAIQDSMLRILYYENLQSSLVYSHMRKMTIRMVVVSLVILVPFGLLAFLMALYIPKTITRPIHELSQVTKQVAGGDLSVRAKPIRGAEMKVLGDSLNAMIEKISSLIDQVTEEQSNLREAELEILQMQINPHFLYNTLDTIVWLAEAGDMDAVVDMVENLSEFFRSTLNGGRDIVTVSEETRHVASYLQIQQVRYQDILDYSIRIPSELDGCQIPKITLQPLVENALYHGIKNKRGMGKISVSGRREGDCCVIAVEDNGIGMTEERLLQVQAGLTDKSVGEEKKDFYGLYNVNERIRLKFGASYGLRIASTHQRGTRVEVWLPWEP